MSQLSKALGCHVNKKPGRGDVESTVWRCGDSPPRPNSESDQCPAGPTLSSEEPDRSKFTSPETSGPVTLSYTDGPDIIYVVVDLDPKSVPKVMNDMILFSYVPLLMGDARSVVRDADKQKSLLDQVAALDGLATVKCAIWMKSRENDVTAPVFVMHKAKAIADHLKAWAEGPIDSMFTFAARVNPETQQYALALYPRIDRSVARWKISFQLTFGYPPPKNLKTQIVFQPLRFISGPGSQFAQSTLELPKRVPIKFLDERFINARDPSKSRFDKVIEVGDVDVSEEGEPFLVQLMKEELKEPVRN